MDVLLSNGRLRLPTLDESVDPKRWSWCLVEYASSEEVCVCVCVLLSYHLPCGRVSLVDFGLPNSIQGSRTRHLTWRP